MKYIEQMKEDIKNYIENEGITLPEDNSEAYEFLEQMLWTVDSVTGNASGSYTFNSYKAKEIVIENITEAMEALQEFCQPAEIGNMFINEQWEAIDVTARCYYLGQAIDEYLEGR